MKPNNTCHKYLNNILQEGDTKLIMRLEELISPETHVHSRRVAKMTEMLLPMTDISPELFPQIIKGALLHDVGKLYVPLNLISYPFPLSSSQKRIISTHALVGAIILTDYSKVIQEVVALHHEKTEIIPNYVLLVQTIDIYDALNSDRAYRAKFTPEKIREIMNEELSDTTYVDLVLSMTKEVSFDSFA